MVHLHARSCYSLLESVFSVERLVDKSVELGYRHVALTDKNSMFAAMRFYKYCRKKNVHPILGLELDVTLSEGSTSFVLLAKNDAGLQALYRLSTEKMKQSGQVTFDRLVKETEDCIVISMGMEESDVLYGYLLSDDRQALEQFFTVCRQSFSSFYAGLICSDSSYLRQKNQMVKALCQTMDIPVCPLSVILYENKEDVHLLRIVKAIQKQTHIHDQTLPVYNDRYLRSPDEMSGLYDREDLENTEKIAAMCNVQMAMEKSRLPVFHNKYDVDSKSFLIRLCHAGLKKRLPAGINEAYKKRLEHELSVILKMGFTDYFLIVYDFIRFARSQGIYVGPGRGSAAGSLVAYCLGITHIDPIKNHLLFERFLNPERISMPDIDTDFPDDRRDEVISYVKDLYGSEHVCHIVTFNTLKAKQVLRDVGRVYQISMRKIDELTKLIGNVPNMTLKKAYEENERFRRLIERDEVCQKLYQTCLPLEGLPRHISLHAAGVVLSHQPVWNVCPLVEVDDGQFATQFSAEYLEDLGLIKMDFLGLRNLTTIDKVVRRIEEKRQIRFDILKLPLNDKKTYQLLSAADTLGVFQLESQGIKELLKQMKPSCFEDICAVLALYRPGAMENMHLYIERKEDPSKIEYPHPLTEPILRETYGIMIYQEQVMQIAVSIGGLSLAQADTLRKAMSKKNPQEMDKFRQLFIQGALKKGCTGKQAADLFDTMARFAGYGFNKSHSYAYSLISYQMAYLKANYPLYFYPCLLDSVIGSQNKTEQYLQECRKRKIRILPPDIVSSGALYEVEDNAIRMPLQVMKGIGKTIYPIVLEERKKANFTDFIDFVVRCSAAKLSESSMRILIDGGALDGFGYNRATLHENLGRVLVYAGLVRTEAQGQISFNFEVVSRPNMTKVKENPIDRANKEYLVYGFYLSDHPVRTIRNKKYPDCIPLNRTAPMQGFLRVIGRITAMHTHNTKQGQTMCFVTIEDEGAKLDLVLMPDLYQREKEKLARDQIVVVQGNKSRPQSLVVRRIRTISPEDLQ